MAEPLTTEQLQQRREFYFMRDTVVFQALGQLMDLRAHLRMYPGTRDAITLDSWEREHRRLLGTEA